MGESSLTSASTLVKERLLARETSQANVRPTPETPLARGTFLVSCTTGPAASAATLDLTTSSTLMTGHDNETHVNGNTNVTSTAGAAGTYAEKAGTFPVGSPTGLAASAASMILTTTTAAGAPGLDDGPRVYRAIDVASTAGTTCTFVDAICGMTGPSVSAATIASHATINYIDNANVDNDDAGIVVPPELVPPEFAGDSAGTAGGTQHYRRGTVIPSEFVGGDIGTAGDTQHFATARRWVCAS